MSVPWHGHDHLSLLTGDGDGSVFVVLDGGAALLNQCAVARSSEECWDTSSSSSDPLGQGSLQKK